jgi:hypothetical protein
MSFPALVALLATASPAPTRVLVLDVRGEMLSHDEAGAIRDRIASEVARRRNVEVISTEDVRHVLDVEAQREATGCAGQSDCLAEIGQALGAGRVIYAAVARLGEHLVVSISMVDPGDARAVGRDTFQADSLGDVNDQIPAAAARLFGERAPVVVPPPGAPVVTITGGVIAGIGAAAGIGFGIATFLAADTVADPTATGANKAQALQQGPLELTATLASAGVLAAGAVITVIGLIVE